MCKAGSVKCGICGGVCSLFGVGNCAWQRVAHVGCRLGGRARLAVGFASRKQRGCRFVGRYLSVLNRGQAVVEGAFLIPVILLMLMLLIQPGILLYDRMVMNAAASEGCRLIATKGTSIDEQAYEEFIRRRLGAIPQQDNFHVHSSGCSWVIELAGGEEAQSVSVSIETQVKPLPFFDFGAQALGLTNAQGNFVQKVEVSQVVRSDWVMENELGSNPQAWIDANKPD